MRTRSAPLHGWLRSHLLWVVLASGALGLADALPGSRFGLNASETWASDLALHPAEPFHRAGLALFTFPLVHAGLAHWLGSLACWLALARAVAARLPRRERLHEEHLLLLYAAASAGIALSYLLPFAPAAGAADRVLGLSALVLFQLGVLLPLRPGLRTWLFAGVLAGALAWQPGSALTAWGHGAGFALGLVTGLALRRGASARAARRPSYPR